MRLQGVGTYKDRAAFTRTELLAVVTIMLTIVFFWGRRGDANARVIRTAVCMENLKQIGSALRVYSSDNRGKLPYAALQPKRGISSTWDRLISTPLRVALRGDDLSSPPPPAGLLLRCPRDSIKAASLESLNVPRRRSYAMTAHKMNRSNWPPSEHNVSGVGLFWSAYRKRGNSSLASVDGVVSVPAVTIDMIRDPAATIVITEQVNPENLVGRPKFATVKSTIEHVDETILPMDSLHAGKINYLMADGRVELLEPAETVGPEGEVSDSADTHFGMWTIVSGD